MPATPHNAAAAAAALKPFFDYNTLSSIVELERASGTKILAVDRPWGDRSLELVIPDDIGPFASVLNNLGLPPRYSAIWHRDTKDFEVLWTAFRLASTSEEIIGRKLLFKFRGKNIIVSLVLPVTAY